MNRVIRNKAVIRHLIMSGRVKNQKDLGEKLGYSNESSFSQVINEKVSEPKDFIPKLKQVFPELNANWLLTGEGEMLVTPPAVMSPYTPDDTAAIMSQQEAMARAMEQGHRVYADAENIGMTIEDAEVVGEHSTMQRCGDTRSLSIEECNELCPARLPYVKGEIVQSRDIDIRQLIESEPQKLEYRTMRQMIGNPDYVQKVITAAMMPLFQPGDLLFIRFLPDDAKLISGAIYLVDTRVYGAMVRQVYLEDNGIYTLHSLNPDFKELHLRRDEIYSISLVARSLRSDFNMPKPTPDATEAYKRREEQMDRLLTMHEESLAEITRQNERMAEERRRQDEERASERIRHDKLIERILKLDQ